MNRFSKFILYSGFFIVTRCVCLSMFLYYSIMAFVYSVSVDVEKIHKTVTFLMLIITLSLTLIIIVLTFIAAKIKNHTKDIATKSNIEKNSSSGNIVSDSESIGFKSEKAESNMSVSISSTGKTNE